MAAGNTQGSRSTRRHTGCNRRRAVFRHTGRHYTDALRRCAEHAAESAFSDRDVAAYTTNVHARPDDSYPGGTGITAIGPGRRWHDGFASKIEQGTGRTRLREYRLHE